MQAACRLKLGYKASAEQFAPRRLLDYFGPGRAGSGSRSSAISDHFQPWRHHGGHAPGVPALARRARRAHASGAARDERADADACATTRRSSPRRSATLACLNPGRVFLGVGTGEAMNETPATGPSGPAPKERRLRLAEAIELMRRLWTEERVTFEGEYYRTERATIYDRPDEPVPIYVAASGPLAAKLAGRVGDGFIMHERQGARALRGAAARRSRRARATPAATRPRSSRMIEIKVSYDHDVEYAREACECWAPLALTPEQKRGVEDPDRAGAARRRERRAIAQRRFIVSNDPDEVVERIGDYVELGFDHLVFHAPGDDQERFLDQFCRRRRAEAQRAFLERGLGLGSVDREHHTRSVRGS